MQEDFDLSSEGTPPTKNYDYRVLTPYSSNPYSENESGMLHQKINEGSERDEKINNQRPVK